MDKTTIYSACNNKGARMPPTSGQDIRLVLRNLTVDDLDRLRLIIAKRYSEYLCRVQGALNTDDLLQETFRDLLEGKRHCNLNKIRLRQCLLGIVRSKFSHIIEKEAGKSRKNSKCHENNISYASDSLGRALSPADNSVNRFDLIAKTEHAFVEKISDLNNPAPDLREQIISFAKDDPFLEQMVTCQLDYLDRSEHSRKPLKPRQLANKLEVDVTCIYNANKRLKRRLKSLVGKSEQALD